MSAPIPIDSARRRCPDERPHQILAAALEVFGERGLSGARLDDIARAAGVAKGTIYLYFANKEELFREVVRHTLVARLDEARALIEAAPDARPTADLLREVLSRWWSYLCTPSYQTVYRLVIGELHRFPDLAQFYVDEVIAPSRSVLGSIVARGVRRGEFRAVDPHANGRITGSMFIAHALWFGRGPGVLMPASLGELTADQVRDQLVDFVLHALRPDSPAASPIADAGAPHA